MKKLILFFAITINVSCSTTLGDRYYTQGLSYVDGINKDVDFEKAFISFNKAAQLDHLKATCLVADSYHRGSGINKSLEKAVEYYKLCIKMRDFNNILALANLYSEKGNRIDALALSYLAGSVGNPSEKEVAKEWQAQIEQNLSKTDLLQARIKFENLSKE